MSSLTAGETGPSGFELWGPPLSTLDLSWLSTFAPPAPLPAASYSGARLAAALTALALGGFAIGTSEFVTMGLLPQIADGIDESIPATGHIISAYALGVVIGAPLIAAASAKLPRRGLLIALMGAYAARQCAERRGHGLLHRC